MIATAINMKKSSLSPMTATFADLRRHFETPPPQRTGNYAAAEVLRDSILWFLIHRLMRFVRENGDLLIARDS